MTVIPFFLGKEQWLCFAGAAVKRYPMPKVHPTVLLSFEDNCISWDKMADRKSVV